jgi:integrase
MKMPRVKLTDAFVRTAPSIDGKLTEYLDLKENGLALRVTPAGVRSWTYRYRNKAGQQRRISLGKVTDISLADARGAVIGHRSVVIKGGDPAAIAEQERQIAKDALKRETVAEVGNWYFRECEAGRHRPNLKRRKRQSTIDLERYYFDRHISSAFGTRKLSELSRAVIQSFVNDLADKNSQSTARQARIILHAICAFAERHELTVGNPVQFVTVAATPPRERVLSDAELRILWNALKFPVDIEGVPISAGVACAIRLAMVTLQRRGEVTGMRLSEINRENRTWTIPGLRAKNHRTHIVPLSPLAFKLLDEVLGARTVESDFVFPSPRDSTKPIDPAAMTRAFGRLKHALGLGDIRPHDLRRSGATNLTGERLGFPRFVVSKVLNHASDSGNAAAVTGIYDQNEYLSEKRRALEAWANRLIEIVEGTERPDNVVSMR